MVVSWKHYSSVGRFPTSSESRANRRGVKNAVDQLCALPSASAEPLSMPPAKRQKPGGISPGKVPTVMKAVGDSPATQSGKGNFLRIGDLFLAHADNSAWGKVWTDVPEPEICTQDFFGSLATYIVDIYEIKEGDKNAGQTLAKSTLVQLWSGLIEHTRNRFSKSTSVQTQERLSSSRRPEATRRQPSIGAQRLPGRHC